MAGMNETPSGERVHVGFFGRRNAGKSSVVNAVTGQELAVVSDVKGTTTDPVKKAMEILPLGPVVIIDTPGFDDEGGLGELRVQKTRQILGKTDIAVLVVDAAEGLKKADEELAGLFKEKNIPYIVALNKSDIAEDSEDHTISEEVPGLLGRVAARCEGMLHVSTVSGEGIDELKTRIAALKPEGSEGRLIADKINEGDLIVLVVPIDKAAPKGRLILPQQQVIRDILDAGAAALVVRDSELSDTLIRLGVTPKNIAAQTVAAVRSPKSGEGSDPEARSPKSGEGSDPEARSPKSVEASDPEACSPGGVACPDPAACSVDARPALVVTDSQAFGMVDAIVPEDIPLTSFSILMARYKGLLDEAVKGVAAIKNLKDGDRVLIAEGCTHHRQCGDIGTVKIPAWLRKAAGKDLIFETASGTGFPEDLSGYALVVHCGGCMLNEKEVTRRTKEAARQGVPITNYGTLIAYTHGILRRSLEIFPEYADPAVH